jgi:peptide/nickel transport system permease protein
MAAVFARTLRTALLGVQHQDYVTAARSFGFHPASIFLHWTFRNALIPYITIVGLQIRYILGGVVVIERIFGVPGIGSLMVDAGFARDYPVVQACTIVFLAIVLAVNLAVDLACSALDPRRTR